MPGKGWKANDYYPGGMLMPGRTYSQSSSKYRYGFNGKENDNEVKGEGNHQDYGMRIYDPRLGRFLSVDPLQADYPWWSPYHFAGNSPILNVDVDGLETYNYNLIINEKSGKSVLTQTTVEHGSLCDLLTVQKVNYNGGIYTIHAEWNYAPYDGFFMVRQLQGKTESELKEYFADKKTDGQQEIEQRQKDDAMYQQAGAIVFGGAALNQRAAKQKTATPESNTNKQVTSANGGNTEAAKVNTATEENVQRPTPAQSEQQLTPSNVRQQVAFKNGREVPKNTKSSVRPEGYDFNTKNSFEVKNYTIGTQKGITNLVNNVVKQVRQRLSNLPQGSIQNLIIDVRGQNATQATLNTIKNRIGTQAGSQNVNIQFKN